MVEIKGNYAEFSPYRTAVTTNSSIFWSNRMAAVISAPPNWPISENSLSYAPDHQANQWHS